MTVGLNKPLHYLPSSTIYSNIFSSYMFLQASMGKAPLKRYVSNVDLLHTLNVSIHEMIFNVLGAIRQR